MEIRSETFGHLWGEEAKRYVLQNDSGMELKITDYGGIITHWSVPDKTGRPTDIVLGFDTLVDYLAGHPYFGALVGRFANRIHAGRFALNGQNFQLATQDRGNHLHGGLRGFDKYIWQSKVEQDADSVCLILQHRSLHMDEGYPGNLDVEVRYTLYRKNCLAIDYFATTDQATIVNLTNHSYFNLSGKQDIGTHSIQIHAAQYLEVDEQQIPTGRLVEMEGSYLDCRRPCDMSELFAQSPGKVVDHCYVLEKSPKDFPENDKSGVRPENTELLPEFCEAAIVEAPSSGIRLRLKTDNPALQFYNGNKLDNLQTKGKQGSPYRAFAGFCLETQSFPDAPNHSHFPSCVLLPGQSYQHRTEFHFENFG